MHSFVVNADNFDVVQAHGPDAVRFLQGQLTCDVTALGNNSQIHGACCNNKGRVIAAFMLVRVADVFYLCMSRGLGAVLVEALRKYLPFYKCALTMATSGEQLFALGATGADEINRLAGMPAMEPGQVSPLSTGWLCKLEGQFSPVLWYCNKVQDEIMTTLKTSGPGTLEQWETLGLLDGRYPFRQSDSGLYTPQELNYDQNGYVSFAKGCYTGQEIVARMHYRGKPKKQLYLVKLAQAVTGPESTQPLLVVNSQNHSFGACRLGRSCQGLNLALLELPADFTGDFASLEVAGLPVLAGCIFDREVIQFSHFINQ